jgi:hypothetical protein
VRFWTAKGAKEVTQSRSRQGYSFKQVSYDTVGACIGVQRQLGVHCVEVDYQRALELAVPKRGLRCFRNQVIRKNLVSRMRRLARQCLDLGLQENRFRETTGWKQASAWAEACRRGEP